MQRLPFLICLFMALLNGTVFAATPHFVGPCFTVHGKLVQSNGDPSLRIWRVGTKRILGILDCKGRDESSLALPKAVSRIAGEHAATSTFGDYTVCPLTKPRTGWMQMVCIKSATHLVPESSK